MSLAARWILSLFFWKSRLDMRLITQVFTLEHLLIMLSDKIWAARAFDELVNLTVATSDQWLVSEQAVKLFGGAGWINHLTILAHRLQTVLRFSIKSMAKMFTICESRVWNLLRLNVCPSKVLHNENIWEPLFLSIQKCREAEGFF